MSALNRNNPNGGGVGDSSISKMSPGGVKSPNHRPPNPSLGGSKFLAGSPSGREAQPNPKAVGKGAVPGIL